MCTFLITLFGDILAVGHAEAGGHERKNVLANKKIEEEECVDWNEGVGSEVLDRMVSWKAIKWRSACGGRDVPKVSHGHQLQQLECGDDRTEPFRQPESVMRVHEKVDETIHEHATALRAWKIHDVEKQEKRGGVVIQMQKANFRQGFAAQKVVGRVQPLPYFGQRECPRKGAKP